MTEDRTLQAIPLAGPFKREHAHVDEPARHAARDPGGDHLRRGLPRVGRQGARRGDDREPASTTAGRSATRTRATSTNGGDQSFASRETPQDPPEITLPELRLRYEAHTAPPPTPPELPAGIEPTTVSCGQVLTEHTLVGNDLSNCPGEGLVIGASNIVVDLNGHKIDGPNYLLENVSGQEEGFPAGIRASGRSNVIIRNGTVQEFGWGVLLSSGTTHSVVDNVEIYRHAVAGVELFDADDGRNGNTVQNSLIADNELGVLIGAESENSLIKNNRIQGNLGEQIFIHNSFGHRIEGNTMHGIPTDPNLDSDGGVLLEGATENVLVDNTVHDTGDAGVMMHMGSHRNTVQGGTYYRNGDAGVIINDSDRNTVDRHHVAPAVRRRRRAQPRAPDRGPRQRPALQPERRRGRRHQQPAGPEQQRLRQPPDRPRARRGRQPADPRQHRRARRRRRHLARGRHVQRARRPDRRRPDHGQQGQPERRRRPVRGRRRPPRAATTRRTTTSAGASSSARTRSSRASRSRPAPTSTSAATRRAATRSSSSAPA